MSRLSTIQDAFQDRLLTGSDAILGHLGERGGRLLSAYDYAYGARLVEVLAKDFEYVHTLLGDDAFEDAAQAYVRAHPSRYRNIRWFGARFPAWLADTAPWTEMPMLAEMAAFEWALGIAFDAPDAVQLHADSLGTVPPEAWPGLSFAPHPAFSLVETTTSVVDFRRVLEDDATPDGPPAALDAPVIWAVWRDPATLITQYRCLGPDEAPLARAMTDGQSFATLCDIAAETGDAETAAMQVAGYLRNWIEAGWLAGLAEDGISRG